MFETRTDGGVLELARPGTDWLSTGWRGGRRVAPAAYSVSVPEGWSSSDVGAYVDRRLAETEFDRSPASPVLLTGVDAANVRGARRGPVEAYATAGVSNPAALPFEPAGGGLPSGEFVAGTVNLVVGTTAALADGALANLVAVVAEAKAATLLSAVGVPGTTSDAVVVASDPEGPEAEFSGSATPVGAAARACVREAVRAALDARYAEEDPPASVDDAEYGVKTDARAEVFRPR